MLRTLLFTAALTACGGDDPAHEQVDCAAGAWGPIAKQQCEQACAAGPECADDDLDCLIALPVCKITDDDSVTTPNCFPEYIANFEGQRGCCKPNTDRVVAFTACQ